MSNLRLVHTCQIQPIFLKFSLFVSGWRENRCILAVEGKLFIV